MAFAPVTGVTRTADSVAALAHMDHGLALRLTRAEFEGGVLPSAIGAFLETHGLSPSAIDLIVDLGPVEEMRVIEGVAGLTSSIPL